MLRTALWLLLILIAVGAAGALYQRLIFDPFRDPQSARAPSTPNWALAAPSGARTEAAATIATPVWRTDPQTLIAALDEAALGEPKTEAVDPPPGDFGSGDPLARIYRQRSALVGFPDYVTAKATEAGEGASLILFSRSVYGISDRGVNTARLERWIGALDRMHPRVD